MKVEPTDGEILSQYALLVWELHHDQERASAFFELAAQTAPKDRCVFFLIICFVGHYGFISISLQ